MGKFIEVGGRLKEAVVPPQVMTAERAVANWGPFFHLIWSCLSAKLYLAKMFHMPFGLPLEVLPVTIFP